MNGIAISMIVLLAAAGNVGDSAEPGELEESLRQAEIAFARTVADKDHDAFLSFLDEDAVFVGQAVSRGREAIGEAWAPLFAPEAVPFLWEPATVAVREGGNLGISTGPYRYEVVTEEGERVIMGGTFVSVWQRQDDGSWKIIFDGGSQARPETD